jgi:hypothetical protein
MNRQMLLVMIFALALTFLDASAFAQAAAESALLNAHSAAVTVKAGSTLGSALNQSTKQLAGHVPQPTSQAAPSQAGSRPSSAIPVKGTAVRSGIAAQGPMIASIESSSNSCVATSQPASTSGSKAAGESAQSNCGGGDSAAHAASQKSKSVITLSFPK